MAEDPSGGWLDLVKGFREVIGAGRDSAKALSELWEWSRKYRQKNWSKVAGKVGAILQRRGISEPPAAPPPRFFLPLVENASYEDDDNLQDLWAGLIANALDPARRQRPKRVFVNLLSSLEPIDAATLKYAINRIHPGQRVTVEQIASSTGFADEELDLSLQNLTRLGCLDSRDSNTSFWAEDDRRPEAARIDGPERIFTIMPLAYELLAACQH